jgi:N utilization substance protein A
MKKEFSLAFNEILDAKGLPREIVLDAIQDAMISAYRKAVNASNAQEVTAKVDLENGGILIFAEKEVVEDIHNPHTEVLLQVARSYNPNIQLGDMVLVESTPEDFGRVAAQTARQVIQQRMREAEREEQLKHFGALVGEVVSGVVQATNPKQITVGLDKQAEAIMPGKEMIRGERFRLHDRVRALLAEVKTTPRGPQIILSRAHKNFLRRLLEDEVPEIYNGLVEIRSISREPGQRSKVAVSAVQPGIDPVGACVGVRGVRIQAIVRELNDEKIDVIEWNANPTEYIAKALSPARVTGVFLDRFAKGAKTATVVVPEDQLSLAIGRDGQNARLAAKLTGWRIDIKSVAEAAGDAIHKLQNDPDYAEIAQRELDNVQILEAILARKAEGRPIQPEEFSLLGQFVTRVEGGLLNQREAEMQAELSQRSEIRGSIPDAAFKTPLEELPISLRFSIELGGAGYSTVGDLLYQLKLNPDEILAVNGIGPKAMEEITAALDTYLAQLPPPVAEEAAPGDTVPTGTPGEPAQPLAEIPPAPQALVEPEPAPEAAQPLPEPAQPSSADLFGIDDKAGIGDLFTFTPEDFGFFEETTSEEGGTEEGDKKKKKGKKKRFVEIEYDPDRDITLVKRKSKRGKDDWGSDWE